jgi:thiol-disulfide isomerase/thioredoxin
MIRPTLPNLFAPLLALLLAGCAIDEVADEARVGTLHFRAVNEAQPDEGVPGLLRSGGQPLAVYSSLSGDWLAVPDLPGDSTLTLSFVPDEPEAWVEQLGVRPWSLPAGAGSDSLTWGLVRRDASLLSATVRTRLGDGTELAGLPLELDGQPQSQLSPAVIQFSAGESHLLRAGDDRCIRGETPFSFDETPATDIVIWLADAILDADAGAGVVILNEQDTGEGQLQITNPPLGLHFLSAYRAGHRADPTGAWIDALCGSETVFGWEPVDGGYAAGQLFPDFRLPAWDPADGAALDSLSLRQLRGRLVLLSFWFIDCPACQEEMPHFQELLEEYSGAGFRVVTLNPLPNDDPAGFPEYDFHFLTDLGIPPVAQQAQVTAFPTNFILRPDGTVRSRHGALTRDALQAILDEFYPAP